MAQEQYVFDEPIGIYGHESHERLAKGVIRDLVLYEETVQATSDPRAELPYLGVNTDRPDEFRLGSLVESVDSRIGHGLALAKPGADPVNMGAVFFTVDRETGPSVCDVKPLIVARPDTYTSHADYQNQVDDLIYSFDKRELEAVMRMIGKMAGSLQLANELRNVDDMNLKKLSVPARMRGDAVVKRHKTTLDRLSMVEPHVHFALRHYSKRELNMLFPSDQPLGRSPERSGVEFVHILECHEIITAAEEIISEQADPEREIDYVNLQCETGDKTYYVKLAAEYGRLFGIQILCDNTGAWASQLFNFDEPDDECNLVGPFWDRDEIAACLRGAETIDDEAYEYNRLLAETSIRADFEKQANVIPIESLRKRPAA